MSDHRHEIPHELFESGPDVFWRAGASFAVEYVSPSVREVLGWDPEEVLGRRITDFMVSDPSADPPVDPLSDPFGELRDAGRSVTIRGRARRSDGSTMWFENRARALYDERREVVGFIGVLSDIGEQIDAEERMAEAAEHQRQAAEALKASEQRHRLLAENASDIVLQASPDGRAVWVSPSIEAALGWRVDEVLGMDVVELVNPDHHTQVSEAQAGAAHGQVTRFEAQYRGKDGRYKWFSVLLKPVHDDEGRIIGRVGSWRDIDEERKVKDALDAARERDRLVARLASDAFMIVSPEGRVDWVSGATERLFGVPPDTLQGADVTAVLSVDDADVRAENLAALTRGETVSGNRKIRRPDGNFRWVDVRSVGLFDDHGALTAIASSVRDAQAEVDYRDALRTALQEARAANLAKTTFLSRMSHELRTPLNAVLGFAQFLQIDALTPEQHTAVRHILTGGHHLLELINEVLDIARIESGRLSVSPDHVSLGGVIAEAVEMVRPLTARQHVTLHEFDADSCRTEVFIDRQRTVQILLNLLSNAIKYNRPDGVVDVECRRDVPGMLTVAVRDQGDGIAPDDLEKLFIPFERLGAVQRGVDGTGIGLALSRGLAEMMNARIEVSSVVGEGSEFRLVVPLASSWPGRGWSTHADGVALPGTEGV